MEAGTASRLRGGGLPFSSSPVLGGFTGFSVGPWGLSDLPTLALLKGIGTQGWVGAVGSWLQARQGMRDRGLSAPIFTPYQMSNETWETQPPDPWLEPT